MEDAMGGASVQVDRTAVVTGPGEDVAQGFPAARAVERQVRIGGHRGTCRQRVTSVNGAPGSQWSTPQLFI